MVQYTNTSSVLLTNGFKDYIDRTNEVIQKSNNLGKDVGDTSSLTTTKTDNLVSAVNELHADIGDVATITNIGEYGQPNNLTTAVNWLSTLFVPNDNEDVTIPSFTVVPVGDLASPTELANYSNNKGNLLVASNNNEYTLYAWTQSTLVTSQPYVVSNSSGGSWIAVAGKYCNSSQINNSSITSPLVYSNNIRFNGSATNRGIWMDASGNTIVGRSETNKWDLREGTFYAILGNNLAYAMNNTTFYGYTNNTQSLGSSTNRWKDVYGYNLDLAGTFKMASGTPDVGKVLTATDALGNASWQAPTAGAWGVTGSAGTVKANFTRINLAQGNHNICDITVPPNESGQYMIIYYSNMSRNSSTNGCSMWYRAIWHASYTTSGVPTSTLQSSSTGFTPGSGVSSNAGNTVTLLNSSSTAYNRLYPLTPRPANNIERMALNVTYSGSDVVTPATFVCSIEIMWAGFSTAPTITAL